MRNIWAFAKREYWHYFASPMAYAVALMFVVVVGVIFLSNVFGATRFGQPPDATVTNSVMTTLFLFFAPIITMRLLADEQRSGTMELLLTGPVREWELVWGKWLGAWFFSLTLLAITAIYPFILTIYGNPDLGPVLTGYLGLALLYGAILALGVLASSFTANLVAAAAIGYGFVLSIWIFQGFVDILTALATVASSEPVQAVVAVMGYLDLPSHYDNLVSVGLINSSDIVYYVSITFIALYITTRIVEARRWR